MFKMLSQGLERCTVGKVLDQLDSSPGTIWPLDICQLCPLRIVQFFVVVVVVSAILSGSQFLLIAVCLGVIPGSSGLYRNSRDHTWVSCL